VEPIGLGNIKKRVTVVVCNDEGSGIVNPSKFIGK